MSRGFWLLLYLILRTLQLMEVSELYRRNILAMKKEKGIGSVWCFFVDRNRWVYYGRKWMRSQNFRCYYRTDFTVLLGCFSGSFQAEFTGNFYQTEIFFLFQFSTDFFSYPEFRFMSNVLYFVWLLHYISNTFSHLQNVNHKKLW